MSIELVTAERPLYAELTPAGAFYVSSGPELEGNRSILFHILREGSRNPFNPEAACRWTRLDSLDDALRSIFRLQRLGLIRGNPEPRHPPEQRLEDVLPGLLAQLSDGQRALLADENGFYLSTSGFLHESAEELAGLSADLLSLQGRHGRLLRNNLRIHSETWALVDPAGQSELGFWPLFIGPQRFMLIIGGTPLLQSQPFVTLVQILDQRYR
ncbi:roadblock/LC7 domain-containing protein [Acidithiobacillus sp. AMEEHan]|uniref:roadblock/LC7 domain-containing protein n=1 Tax=Acidithiobacillus sp. AMEEHan TaxID=2994951 RepID=UPI0027E52721|nr:roadblock/LC7 domain-containing protein [Acidithiobacillus sp. AMEEHan]